MNSETNNKRRYIKKFRYPRGSFLQYLQRKLSSGYNLIEEVVNKSNQRAVIETKNDLIIQRIINNDLNSIWHSINQIHLKIDKLNYKTEQKEAKETEISKEETEAENSTLSCEINSDDSTETLQNSE